MYVCRCVTNHAKVKPLYEASEPKTQLKYILIHLETQAGMQDGKQHHCQCIGESKLFQVVTQSTVLMDIFFLDVEKANQCTPSSSMRIGLFSRVKLAAFIINIQHSHLGPQNFRA